MSGADTPADTAKGVHAILDSLHKKFPTAKVLLISILPRAGEKLDTKVHDTNALIARFADNIRVHYLDLAVHFEISLGVEVVELFVADHVHLTAKGYELWYKTMEASFVQLTGASSSV